MSKLVEYMKEAKIFYLATINGDKPSIRPIGGKPVLGEDGFVEVDEKVYFYTDTRKPMFKQMSENSSVAITFIVADGFIRLTANAVFDGNVEAKKRLIDENKSLTLLYSAEDEFFTTYYLSDIQAYLYAKGQEPLKLS